MMDDYSVYDSFYDAEVWESRIISDSKTIEDALSQADYIFYYDIGDEVIELTKNRDKLVRNNLFGGLAYKPISDVRAIISVLNSSTWQVIWKT